MPGLAGTCGPNAVQMRDAVVRMVGTMGHAPSYVGDEVYREPGVCGSRVTIGVLPQEPQPYRCGNLLVWLEGEVIQVDQGGGVRVASPEHSAEALAKVFLTDGIAGLSRLDGAFAAAVWERDKGILHLCVDRFGLRQLFWTRVGDALAWASESKAFLVLEGFSPQIDEEAVTQFLGIGYLLDERTWFSGVRLVPAAGVVSWDYRLQRVNVQRHWWWDRIAPLQGGVDERECVEEAARLFRQSVGRRSQTGEKVGIFLSGGLDSRALLAAASELDSCVPTFTFGREGCSDARIARRASKVAGSRHHVVAIEPENWLEPRLPGVWWTEGQYSLLHMHGMEARGAVRSLCSVNLNGFAGDLVFGGSYMQTAAVLDRFDRDYAARIMGCDVGLLGDTSAYEGLGKVDYLFLNQRVRRFTLMGTVNWLTIIHDRQPFLANALMEFLYSLPDVLRYENRLYRQVLMSAFPRYYRSIPWQKTGVPIAYPLSLQRLGAQSIRARRRAARLVPRLSSALAGVHDFVDYEDWLRREPARSFAMTTLADGGHHLPGFVNADCIRRDVVRYMQGAPGAEKIGRYLTLEIWLRQVFAGEYRPPVFAPSNREAHFDPGRLK